MKIALIFNKERADTTGSYFEKVLRQSSHNIEHFWTEHSHSIKPEFDLYFRIDHGDYKYDIPEHLHPAAFLAIDTHLKKPYKKIEKQVGHYDFIFCAQKDGVEKLKRRKKVNTCWVPFACDPEIHKKLNLAKKYDIGFVGTDGKKSLRKVLLKELGKRYPRSFLGRAPFTDMSRIYSASKIVFNYSIRNDINMRMFEVMSCGALLITNRIKRNGFEELFQGGKHLITYRNRKELFKLIDYYLTHDKKREEIARDGHLLVTRNHTYKIRTEKLLNYIKQKLAQDYPGIT